MKRNECSNFYYYNKLNSNFQINKDEVNVLPSNVCPTEELFNFTHDNNMQINPLEDIESTSANGEIISDKNNNLFFIESSGRSYLTARETCAIESAIINSGLDGNIIIAMTSKFLDLYETNATHQLYIRHAERRIHFRYVNVGTIFKGTPLHSLHVDNKLRNGEDRLREIVQYRYDNNKYHIRVTTNKNV